MYVSLWSEALFQKGVNRDILAKHIFAFCAYLTTEIFSIEFLMKKNNSNKIVNGDTNNDFLWG